VLDICGFDKDEGEGSKNVIKWYFDHNLQKCVPFIFNGNGGNPNNFETEDLCLSTCRNKSSEIKFENSAEALDVDPIITSITMSILVNEKMSPEFTILAFYVEDDEVIPDSVSIPVKKCLQNKVKMICIILILFIFTNYKIKGKNRTQ
jgi:hypothetical protein